MRRRTVLSSLGAAALGLAAAVSLSSAALASQINFKPGAVQAALKSGKAVLLEYSTDWCPTCAAQKRAVAALRQQKPDYNDKIVFIRVDYDAYRNHPVATSRNVPRRSTLVLLKGDRELGRVVAVTSRRQIGELLDKAL